MRLGWQSGMGADWGLDVVPPLWMVVGSRCQVVLGRYKHHSR
jgi:hypothetical protein